MPVHRYRKPRASHHFVGTWHITEMELWDEDYLNMERQAFVRIRPDDSGEFQFGLVRGMLDGYLEDEPPDQRFAFSWDGSDEMDPVCGSGWMRLRGMDEVRGLIKIHLMDRSTFTARRVGEAALTRADEPAAGTRERAEAADGSSRRRPRR
jgi:hypothetical protein